MAIKHFLLILKNFGNIASKIRFLIHLKKKNALIFLANLVDYEKNFKISISY